MSVEIEDLKLEDVVKVINPDTVADGEMTNSTTIAILKECDNKGKVTQIQDGLVYVGFVSEIGWVTQVFKPEELEEVK